MIWLPPISSFFFSAESNPSSQLAPYHQILISLVSPWDLCTCCFLCLEHSPTRPLPSDALCLQVPRTMPGTQPTLSKHFSMP